jgi:prepilin signal peptidase PulO-like enzyme (type II secretory pathway)
MLNLLLGLLIGIMLTVKCRQFRRMILESMSESQPTGRSGSASRTAPASPRWAITREWRG